MVKPDVALCSSTPGRHLLLLDWHFPLLARDSKATYNVGNDSTFELKYKETALTCLSSWVSFVPDDLPLDECPSPAASVPARLHFSRRSYDAHMFQSLSPCVSIMCSMHLFLISSIPFYNSLSRRCRGVKSVEFGAISKLER